MTLKLSKFAIVFTVVVAAITLIMACLSSLGWSYTHDSPLMIYAGWLVEQGAVPYRDFFDMNMPGNYFVMWVMGAVFGWDDIGFRIFDLLCLASISVSTFAWMRRFGKLPALVAAVAFPLWYIGQGPRMSMQREFIALVPFAWLLVMATTQTRFTPMIKALLVGVLAATTILIKPQFLLLCLPAFVVLIQNGQPSVSARRLVAALIAGVALPVGSTIIYLVWTQSLAPFLDMAKNYWPLYTHMTGTHETISGLHRLSYLVKSTRDGLMTFYFPMAIVGLTVLSFLRSHKRDAMVLGAILLAAAIYPATSGQFWQYHWMPFYYIALCLASLSVCVVSIEERSQANMAPLVCMIFVLLSLSSLAAKRPIRMWKGYDLEKHRRTTISWRVHNYLSTHMKPGDTVQPLDWAGGAVHGMLLARAPLATSFMYNFHFYHHIDKPYIKELRRKFMDELVASHPRFIIVVHDHMPGPSGENTSTEFPELDTYLEQHYETVQYKSEHSILERKNVE